MADNSIAVLNWFKFDVLVNDISGVQQVLSQGFTQVYVLK